MGCNTSVTENARKHAANQPLSTKNRDATFRENLLSYNAGRLIGNYYTFNENVLGTAGFGCQIREITNIITGEKLACKTFTLPKNTRKTSRTDKKSFGMLKNEIELLKSMDHPNIISPLECYETERELHMTMQLCTGGTLCDRRHSEVQTAKVLEQILSAIAYSHRHKVCHRDLKMENILYETEHTNSEVKLIDFGISKKFVDGQKMTEKIGTPYTIAPEVLLGQGYTSRCDMWSVGCITFNLLTGRPPFDGPNDDEMFKKIFRVEYKWPQKPPYPISDLAKDFVKNLLVFEPRRRWSANRALISDWLQHHRNAANVANSSNNISNNNSNGRNTSSAATDRSSAATSSAQNDPNGQDGGFGLGLGIGVDMVVANSSRSSGDQSSSRHSNENSNENGDSYRGSLSGRFSPTFTTGNGTTTTTNHSSSSSSNNNNNNKNNNNGFPPITPKNMVRSMERFSTSKGLRKIGLMVIAYRINPTLLSNLRHSFQEIDTERTGHLSRSELRAVLLKFGVANNVEINKLFEAMDVDQSGRINFIEFLGSTIEVMGDLSDDRILDAFNQLDVDQSGLITEADLRTMLGKNGDDKMVHQMMMEAGSRKHGPSLRADDRTAAGGDSGDKIRQLTGGIEENPPTLGSNNNNNNNNNNSRNDPRGSHGRSATSVPPPEKKGSRSFLRQRRNSRGHKDGGGGVNGGANTSGNGSVKEGIDFDTFRNIMRRTNDEIIAMERKGTEIMLLEQITRSHSQSQPASAPPSQSPSPCGPSRNDPVPPPPPPPPPTSSAAAAADPSAPESGGDSVAGTTNHPVEKDGGSGGGVETKEDLCQSATDANQLFMNME